MSMLSRSLFFVFCVIFESGCGVLMSVREHERIMGEERESMERERSDWREEEERKKSERMKLVVDNRELLKRVETLREMRRVGLEESKKKFIDLSLELDRVLGENDLLRARIVEFESEKKKEEEVSVREEEEVREREEEESRSECGSRYNELECYAVALLGRKYFYDMLADGFRERAGVYLSRGDIEKVRRRVLKRKNRWELCSGFSVGYGRVELNEVTYFSNNNFGLNSVRVEDKKFFELMSNIEYESDDRDMIDYIKGLNICLSFSAAAGTSNEWDGEWNKHRYVYAKPIEVWIKRGEQRVYKFSRSLVRKMVTPFKKTCREKMYDKKRIYEVY